MDRRRLKGVCLAAACLAGCTAASAEELSGDYHGVGVTLSLKKHDDGYKGTITTAGKTYPVAFTEVDGDRMSGTFGADRFKITARAVDTGLKLNSAGKDFTLKRTARGNPLAAPRLAGSGGAGDEPSPAPAAATTAAPSVAASDQPKAQPVAATDPAPKWRKLTRFNGSFTATLDGKRLWLSLRQQDATLSGSARVGDYRYTIRGKASDDRASGVLGDPSTGGTIPFTMTLAGKRLTLRFANKAIAMQRSRGPVPAAAVAPRRRAPSSGGASRNPALVGLWSRTDSMSSGGASYASKQYLEIRANGTFRTGAGRTAGGGAGWSMSSGGGVEITGRGRWKTRGRIIHVNEGAGWQPFARFYTTGAKLMFTFSNGRRQIWYRSR